MDRTAGVAHLASGRTLGLAAMTLLGDRQPHRMSADAPVRFASHHRWDRAFFLGYLLLMWFVIVVGFAPEIVRHVQRREAPYPLVVHLHAVAFVGWLVLLAAQVLLIRAKRRDIHRRLGVVGAVLAAAMIVLGPATAFVVDRQQLGTPASDPAFLSVQLLDIVGFAGAAAAAIVLRGDPSAHKRLILLATLCLIDAGFTRWLGEPLLGLLGTGFWPFMAEVYLANVVLILGIGGYDLVTRRRLHPVYVAGAVWVLANLGAAAWLYNSAFWKPIALRLIAG